VGSGNLEPPVPILITSGRKKLQKRFYILFVARGDDGQLRKIPIPVHYLYVFLVGAVIVGLSLTGIASSYVRMALKVSRYNTLRTEKEDLTNRYSRLEQVAQEKDIQVASLGSLAGEVSSLYGLKSDPNMVTASSENVRTAQVVSSLDQLGALKASALTGATMTGISLGLTRDATTADWLRANSAPNLWPVEGPITGSFGERIDPFNGEGAFHSGVDIGSSDGQAIIAPADGIVVFADFMGGYGRAVIVDHGHGISTRYGHLGNFAVISGQHVHRGDTLGYVGESGRSTGPHLHYEVRINDTPVNPHKYLRLTYANVGGFSAGS
jgi:murein DD-endopeptidase MepM/ murein hydrolase activator NlpD